MRHQYQLALHRHVGSTHSFECTLNVQPQPILSETARPHMPCHAMPCRTQTEYSTAQHVSWQHGLHSATRLTSWSCLEWFSAVVLNVPVLSHPAKLPGTPVVAGVDNCSSLVAQNRAKMVTTKSKHKDSVEQRPLLGPLSKPGRNNTPMAGDHNTQHAMRGVPLWAGFYSCDEPGRSLKNELGPLRPDVAPLVSGDQRSCSGLRGQNSHNCSTSSAQCGVRSHALCGAPPCTTGMGSCLGVFFTCWDLVSPPRAAFGFRSLLSGAFSA